MSDSELARAIAELPEGTIKYETTFVPYKDVSDERKHSWGGGDHRHGSEPNFFLSWTVKINGEEFEYHAGIGHISDERVRKITQKFGWTAYDLAEIESWVNGYMRRAGADFKPAVPQKAPELVDVLHCLLMELTALDYDFEEWASEYGYDTDSREAEKTYKACRDQAYRTIRALGAETVEKLRNLEH